MHTTCDHFNCLMNVFVLLLLTKYYNQYVSSDTAIPCKIRSKRYRPNHKPHRCTQIRRDSKYMILRRDEVGWRNFHLIHYTNICESDKHCPYLSYQPNKLCHIVWTNQTSALQFNFVAANVHSYFAAESRLASLIWVSVINRFNRIISPVVSVILSILGSLYLANNCAFVGKGSDNCDTQEGYSLSSLITGAAWSFRKLTGTTSPTFQFEKENLADFWTTTLARVMTRDRPSILRFFVFFYCNLQ